VSSQYGDRVTGERGTRLGDDRPDRPPEGAGPGQRSDNSDKDDGSPVRFQRIRRFRAAIKRRRALNATWRIVVFIAGVVIILAGLAMLALPGPGWAAVFVGLAVLATEFDWAHRLLHRAKEKVQAATTKAQDPRRRRLLLVLGAVVLVVGGGVGWWYVDRYGWALPW
jgi:uncharacterized protein (TIGR02611 family)